MKKIIIACAGNTFPDSALDFAIRLNELGGILLTGVFMKEIIYPGDFGFTGTGIIEMPAVLTYLEEDKAALAKNIKRFRELCEKNGIEYRIHEGTSDFSLPQLKKETRFADLLIISNEDFFNSGDEQTINDYLKVTLRRSECPVLIVPGKFDFPENILLAYDGSKSSVYAIKMFAYLFPELCSNSAVLVYLDKHGKDVPDRSFIEELAPRHFSDLTIMNLDNANDNGMGGLIGSRKNLILVIGAFERSALSEFFDKSFAEELIKVNKFPIFIAHK